MAGHKQVMLISTNFLLQPGGKITQNLRFTAYKLCLFRLGLVRILLNRREEKSVTSDDSKVLSEDAKVWHSFQTGISVAFLRSTLGVEFKHHEEGKKAFLTEQKKAFSTYIIFIQIRMVPLNSIVENGHDDSFSCISLLPCGTHVHVETVFGATILKNVQKTDIDES